MKIVKLILRNDFSALSLFSICFIFVLYQTSVIGQETVLPANLKHITPPLARVAIENLRLSEVTPKKPESERIPLVAESLNQSSQTIASHASSEPLPNLNPVNETSNEAQPKNNVLHQTPRSVPNTVSNSKIIEPTIIWPSHRAPSTTVLSSPITNATPTTLRTEMVTAPSTATATKVNPQHTVSPVDNNRRLRSESIKELPSPRISINNPSILENNQVKISDSLNQFEIPVSSTSGAPKSPLPAPIGNSSERKSAPTGRSENLTSSSDITLTASAGKPETPDDSSQSTFTILVAVGGCALALASGAGGMLYFYSRKNKRMLAINNRGIQSHIEEEVYIVHIPYVPELEDELKLLVGDQVSIQERFQDNWVLGTNLITGESGCFPMVCLDAAAASSAFPENHSTYFVRDSQASSYSVDFQQKRISSYNVKSFLAS